MKNSANGFKMMQIIGAFSLVVCILMFNKNSQILSTKDEYFFAFWFGISLFNFIAGTIMRRKLK